MSMEWFRWYHGTVSNPKLALIAKKAGQSRPVTIAVWAALLEQASKSDLRGDVSNFDVETIAVALDIEEDAINAIIAAMTAKGMIADQRIAQWEARQPQREDPSTERVRAFRERQKRDETNGNAPETLCNAVKRDETHGNAPDKDTDTDSEERREEVSQESVPAQAPNAPTLTATPSAQEVEPEAAPESKAKPAPAKAKPKGRAAAKTSLPADFAITPELQAWADQHHYGDLTAHLDNFRDKVAANGYRYADWVAAFRNAVRDDWAKLRTFPDTRNTRARNSAANVTHAPPTTPPSSPEAAEFDAILRNLSNRPALEGTCTHEIH